MHVPLAIRRGIIPAKAAPPGGAIVWDPADADPNIVLSNGNRTATLDPGGSGYNNVLVVAADGRTSGKWYAELQIEARTGEIGVGLADTSAALSGYLGSSTHSAAEYSDTSIWYNGSSAGSGVPWGSPPFRIGIAFDADAKKLWFVNGSGSAPGDPAAGTGGVSVPGLGSFYIAAGLETPGDSVTLVQPADYLLPLASSLLAAGFSANA